MEHAIYSDSWQELVVADGDSVIVIFDYKANHPRRIPDVIRQSIESFEGTSL
jgi:acyl-CoA thioesterase FadM